MTVRLIGHRRADGVVPSDEVERIVRRAGTALAILGVAATVFGILWLVISPVERGVQLAIGGLVTALLGSVLLLFAPDRLPPSERP